MYCQSCANELTLELSFCNRCGARVNNALESPTPSPAKVIRATWAISAAMTFVTLGGFFAVLFCLMAILERNLPLQGNVVFLLFCFLSVVLAVDMLLGWQLSRIISLNQHAEEAGVVKKPQLKSRSVPQLSEMREPLPSVTENTTQFFEPMKEKRGRQTGESFS
jgi:hypothetical protein